MTEQILVDGHNMIIPVSLEYFFTLLFVIAFIKLQMTDIMSQNFDYNNEQPGMSKCPNCQVTKRPDIYHCTECEACVEGHDHHCGVVGNCIGDVNMKYFIQFIAYGGMQVLFFGVTKQFFDNNRFNKKRSEQNGALVFGVLGILIIFGGTLLVMACSFLS